MQESGEHGDDGGDGGDSKGGAGGGGEGDGGGGGDGGGIGGDGLGPMRVGWAGPALTLAIRKESGVGRPSANAGDQEGEEHLEIVRRAPAQSRVGGGAECSEGWWESRRARHRVSGSGWLYRRLARAGGRGGSEGRAAYVG